MFYWRWWNSVSWTHNENQNRGLSTWYSSGLNRHSRRNRRTYCDYCWHNNYRAHQPRLFPSLRTRSIFRPLWSTSQYIHWSRKTLHNIVKTFRFQIHPLGVNKNDPSPCICTWKQPNYRRAQSTSQFTRSVHSLLIVLDIAIQHHWPGYSPTGIVEIPFRNWSLLISCNIHKQVRHSQTRWYISCWFSCCVLELTVTKSHVEKQVFARDCRPSTSSIRMYSCEEYNLLDFAKLHGTTAAVYHRAHTL